MGGADALSGHGVVAGEPLSALLAREGRLRVDRSLAIVAQPLGQGQGDEGELLVGTAGYLSPEQASAKRRPRPVTCMPWGGGL